MVPSCSEDLGHRHPTGHTMMAMQSQTGDRAVTEHPEAQPSAPGEHFPKNCSSAIILELLSCLFALNTDASPLGAGSPNRQTGLGRNPSSWKLLPQESGPRDPGEPLATSSARPLMVPQPVAPEVSPPQALAPRASLTAQRLQGSEGTGCCAGPGCPTSSSRPAGTRRSRRARLAAPTLGTQLLTAFPRISHSLFLLSGFPSPCPLPDSLVSLDASCIRSVLQWWHQAQASKSSFDSAETSGEEPRLAHASRRLPCGSFPGFSAFQY